LFRAKKISETTTPEGKKKKKGGDEPRGALKRGGRAKENFVVGERGASAYGQRGPWGRCGDRIIEGA